MQPHSCDLRKGRVSIIGQVYLLTTSTENRVTVFDDFQAARLCISSRSGSSFGAMVQPYGGGADTSTLFVFLSKK